MSIKRWGGNNEDTETPIYMYAGYHWCVAFISAFAIGLPICQSNYIAHWTRWRQEKDILYIYIYISNKAVMLDQDNYLLQTIMNLHTVGGATVGQQTWVFRIKRLCCRLWPYVEETERRKRKLQPRRLSEPEGEEATRSCGARTVIHSGFARTPHRSRDNLVAENRVDLLVLGNQLIGAEGASGPPPRPPTASRPKRPQSR